MAAGSAALGAFSRQLAALVARSLPRMAPRAMRALQSEFDATVRASVRSGLTQEAAEQTARKVLGDRLAAGGFSNRHLLMGLIALMGIAIVWNWLYNAICRLLGRRLTCACRTEGADGFCEGARGKIREFGFSDIVVLCDANLNYDVEDKIIFDYLKNSKLINLFSVKDIAKSMFFK